MTSLTFISMYNVFRSIPVNQDFQQSIHNLTIKKVFYDFSSSKAFVCYVVKEKYDAVGCCFCRLSIILAVMSINVYFISIKKKSVFDDSLP